jgi:hypothetical protein
LDDPLLAELDLVRRALALRKKRLIGVFYAHEHSYYLASDELDPFGSRTRVSLAQLAVIVDQADAQTSQGDSRERPNNNLACKTNRQYSIISSRERRIPNAGLQARIVLSAFPGRVGEIHPH